MNKVFTFFGGRKNFNLLITFVLGFVLVLLDKLAGDMYFASLIAGLGVYSHYNVKTKKINGEKIDETV